MLCNFNFLRLKIHCLILEKENVTILLQQQKYIHTLISICFLFPILVCTLNLTTHLLISLSHFFSFASVFLIAGEKVEMGDRSQENNLVWRSLGGL